MIFRNHNLFLMAAMFFTSSIVADVDPERYLKPWTDTLTTLNSSLVQLDKDLLKALPGNQWYAMLGLPFDASADAAYAWHKILYQMLLDAADPSSSQKWSALLGQTIKESLKQLAPSLISQMFSIKLLDVKDVEALKRAKATAQELQFQADKFMNTPEIIGPLKDNPLLTWMKKPVALIQKPPTVLGYAIRADATDDASAWPKVAAGLPWYNVGYPIILRKQPRKPEATSEPLAWEALYVMPVHAVGTETAASFFAKAGAKYRSMTKGGEPYFCVKWICTLGSETDPKLAKTDPKLAKGAWKVTYEFSVDFFEYETLWTELKSMGQA